MGRVIEIANRAGVTRGPDGGRGQVGAPDLFGDAVADDTAARRAFVAYNIAALRCGWHLARDLTETRRRKIRQRLDQAGGLTQWKLALTRAAVSDFLCGRGGNFMCHIDFLLQESSFQKLIEGKYDNRAPTRSRAIEAIDEL